MTKFFTDSRAEQATEVVRRLREAGHRACFVGGCVRDLLLGRRPADYDVATDAQPPAVARLFPGSLLVGAQFGVVLIKKDGQEIAVATYRTDNRYVDGRHPESVSYASDPRQDVLRRDFTINGLLLDPLLPGPLASEVIDFVGGRADLEAGLIRTIGSPDERFAEDKLRMLRAIRFAARFRFRIEERTWDAMRRLHAGIQDVSSERIRDEILKILAEGGAAHGMRLLDESGMLAGLLPEVTAMKGVEQPPEFHPEGDVWTHTLMMLEGLPANPSPTLALGVLLHDVGKPPTFRVADRIRFDNHSAVGAKMAERICERLRMSRRETEQIVALVDNHLRFKDVMAMRPSKLKRFMQLDHFDEHMELHRLDCISSHGYLDNYEFLQRKLAEMPPEELRPVPLVTGDDLIAAGYEPGPAFKEMLNAALDAQMEGDVATKDAALEFVRSRYPRQ